MDSNLMTSGGTAARPVLVSGLRVSDAVNKATSAPSLLLTHGTALPVANRTLIGAFDATAPAPPPRDAPV